MADVLEKYGNTIDYEDILDDTISVEGSLEVDKNGVCTSLDEAVSNGDVLTLHSIIVDKLSG